MKPAVLRDFINEILIRSTILGSDSHKSIIDGLTPKQVHIMMEIGTSIYRHGDLASRLGVEPSTLTRTLDPLVKNGNVDRGLNPDNRREVQIRLSTKGLSVLGSIHEEMDKHCTAILRQVPQEKQEQVEDSLKLLLDIMKKSPSNHG